MTIILPIDQHEGAAFVHWLRARGHDACIGGETGARIDGVWTSTSTDASDTLRRLWDHYCEEG